MAPVVKVCCIASVGSTTLQLVDRVPRDELRRLRRLRLDVEVAQVVHVVDEASVDEAQAVATVRPHGLDLCSRVRIDGRLDGARLSAFMAAVAAAGALGATSAAAGP